MSPFSSQFVVSMTLIFKSIRPKLFSRMPYSFCFSVFDPTFQLKAGIEAPSFKICVAKYLPYFVLFEWTPGNKMSVQDSMFLFYFCRVWGCPTVAMWVYRVGAERAKRLLFTGDLIDGKEAARIGLVGEVSFVTTIPAKMVGTLFGPIFEIAPSPPGSMLKYDFEVTRCWDGSTLPGGVGESSKFSKSFKLLVENG